MTRTSSFVSVAVLAAAFSGGAQTAESDTFPPPVPWREARPDNPPPPPPPDADEPADATPPAEALPPAKPPDLPTFEEWLRPWGRWVATPEYGTVWIPAAVDPDWQPYTDGRWVATDWGWSFVAAAPWGRVTFHYGRWGFEPAIGWFWVPGFVWAPAWVYWRVHDGFICWAAFAPRGYRFGPAWRGWVVVPSRHFTHSIPRFRLPSRFVGPIVRKAAPAPSIRGPVRGFFGPPRPRPTPKALPRR